MYSLSYFLSSGGQGQFIRFRHEQCKTTDSPCLFPADGVKYTNEFTFIPSQNVEQLSIKIFGSINGTEPIVAYEHPLENRKVIGGQEQTIYFKGGVPKEKRGGNLTVQIILNRVVDQITEMCVEADFILV